MTLSDATEGFLNGYFSTCRRSDKTRTAYGIDLAQLQSYLGAQDIALITPNQLEAWARELQSQGYASASIRRKFATVRMFFGHWVRRGELTQSPLWKIRLDLGRERVLPRNLTASDTQRLIETAWRGLDPSTGGTFTNLRDLAAIEILFATGIRVGELVALRVSDWREDDGSFLISGKGSRQRLALLPDERSLHVVRMYVSQRAGRNLGHEILLVNSVGARISTQGIARILSQVAKLAGIEARVTPHMIRHTVATLLLRYGADIRVVQEVLGHASITTTQRYTHVSKDHLLSTLRARHPNHHLTIETTLPRNPATAKTPVLQAGYPPKFKR